MTVLAPPRHPLVEQALINAQHWCAGHVIDDRPALTHAARVAVTIGHHQPSATAEVIAAALLHDAPEFAPADVDLDQLLAARYGDEVLRLIREMQIEHQALDREQPILPDPTDAPLMLLSTADKVVALTSLVRRAKHSGNVTDFFAGRRPLLGLFDHFRSCQQATVGAVPDSMSTALAMVLDALGAATNGLPVQRPAGS